MASKNEDEIIELEIISLKRALDKYDKDYLIITGMITDLMNNRIGISEERIQLTKMIGDREIMLAKMGKT
jgi:hypothetical protein